MRSTPYKDTDLARYLTKRILELRGKKNQAQIAEEAGFKHANMITLLKSGASKLPLDRVPAMARALECDAAFLLRLALAQAEGDTMAAAIHDIMGTPISSNEFGWLEEIRTASGDTDPRLTSRMRTGLRALFGK